MTSKPSKKLPVRLKASPPDCVICYFPTINNRICYEPYRSVIISRKMDNFKRHGPYISNIDGK